MKNIAIRQNEDYNTTGFVSFFLKIDTELNGSTANSFAYLRIDILPPGRNSRYSGGTDLRQFG